MVFVWGDLDPRKGVNTSQSFFFNTEMHGYFVDRKITKQGYLGYGLWESEEQIQAETPQMISILNSF